jgi:DNA-binding response OmpR family regulator
MDGPRLTGLIVLVLEDEPLVSLDVVDALKSVGAGVRAAATVDSALQLLDEIAPSVAVLDINLVGDECGRVCQRLWERGVPFMFHTGYSTARALTMWPDVPVIRKPASYGALVDAVVRLCGKSPSAMQQPRATAG